MRNIIMLKDWTFWLVLAIFAFGIPFVIDFFNFSDLLKIIGFYFIVNSLFSIGLSLYVRRRGAFIGIVIIWPIMFAIGVAFGLVPALYGYALAGMYLVIELLAFYTGQQNDKDLENQIPIENGFQSI
ncbi:hypothetical protein [Weissella minor]|nr:hypothetical protein [Weissella minor]